ncbi:hypothetical protein RhiTH_006931 [Rhizoctonia solani]
MASLGKLSARNIIWPGKDIIKRNSALSAPSTFLDLLPAFDTPGLSSGFCRKNSFYLGEEGGYNGMNLWVPQTNHLGHISYVAVQIYQKIGLRAKYRAIHLGRPMEIPYYQLVPTNELLMRVGIVNTPGSETEDVELKDRHILKDRNELTQLLPELEKAGILRVGSKTGAGS